MQAIATYEERLPERRHRFELFPDTIYVRGSTTQTEVETTIPLVQLDPSIMRVWVYSQRFFIGFWVFLVGIVLLLVVVFVVMSQGSSELPDQAPGTGVQYCVGGDGSGHSEPAQNRVCPIPLECGGTDLGIARAGTGDFDQFIALLEKQNRIARGQAGIGGSAIQYRALDH